MQKLFFLFVLLASPFFHEIAWGEAMVVRLCVDNNSPMVSVADNREIKGIGIDILNHVAKQENLKLEAYSSTWDTCYKHLLNGETDVIFPIAFSNEITLNVLFNNETVLANWGQIYASEKSTIKSILDLNNKKIAVIASDIFFNSNQGLRQFLKAFGIDVTYLYFDSYKAIMEAVSSGKADAGLLNRLFAQTHADEYNVKGTPVLVSPIKIHFGLPKNKQKSIILASMIDKSLKQMKADKNSQYHEFLDKSLYAQEKNNITPTILIYGSVGIIVFLFIAAGLFFILKRKMILNALKLTQTNTLLTKELEEKKLEEKILKNSEEKYNSLFQASLEPVIIIDSKGIINDSNTAMERQLGYLRQEILNKNITYLFPEFVLQEDLPDLTKENEQHFKKELYRKNGDKLNAEIITSSFNVAETRFIKVIIRDMGENKENTQILTQKKRDPETLFEHNRVQEQMMMQQSKLNAMGEMINAIAHQWRQSLTTIGLYVQDVEDAFQYHELDIEYIRQFNDSCMEQIAYMSKTIEDFKNFFKSDQEKVIFSICDITREVITLIIPQLVNNNIELKVFFNNKPLLNKQGVIELPTETKQATAYGYPNEFKQVIVNLISNARSAILESRNEDNEYEHGEITLIFEYTDNIINLTIEDNGIGIPDEILDKIFTPNFSTKKDRQSAGVELYMSKIIIESNMGGRIYVNKREKGASFTISLKGIDLKKPIS